jgi:LAO/AO transport system kinase
MVNLESIIAGDRKSLAKAITLLESSRIDHRKNAEELLAKANLNNNKSIRIGLTGVPGVGKSTLIESLGTEVIKQGHKIAVLAVDPSSTLSGGSILGDKTRMPSLSTNPNAFIRPSPAGESWGGVARRTRESIVLCEAAGFDVIIVETVGVGQSETLVSQMTDIFVLMLLPGGGDELQGIKRGIMELADLVVINKADGDFKSKANIAAASVQQALRLIKPRYENWRVPVTTISALEKQGILGIWEKIISFMEMMQSDGFLDKYRSEQSRNWLWIETRELLVSRFMGDESIKQAINEYQERVVSGTISPGLAADQLVSTFLKN